MSNVLLVQGTWGDDDPWWRRTQTYPNLQGTFADAVVACGHTLVGEFRPFEWSTDLGGIGFGNRDLNTWKGAGRHLYDYCDPPRVAAPIPDLVIIGHSHARQVIKFACAFGLTVPRVILISGPIRKDVDEATQDARTHIGHLVCLNGGRQDRMQWLGEMFDGHLGIRRQDPDADVWKTYSDADHGSLLRVPAQYSRVLAHIRSV